MKNRWGLKIVIFSILYLCTSNVYSEMHALIIGNANYDKISKLKNPINDAQDIANTLNAMNSNVTLLKDATVREMKDAIVSISANLKRDDSFVFYYAGHGVQFNGENYLIPIDADIRTEKDIPYESLSVNYLLDYINEYGGTFNFVILDSCRDNPFSTFRSLTRGLAVVQAPKSSIVLYATGAGQAAEDGYGNNSIFTMKLLEALSVENIRVDDLIKYVGNNVAISTNNKQTPAFYSNFFGEYLFNSNNEAVALPIRTIVSVSNEKVGSHSLNSGLSIKVPYTFSKKLEGVWPISNSLYYLVDGNSFSKLSYQFYDYIESKYQVNTQYFELKEQMENYSNKKITTGMIGVCLGLGSVALAVKSGDNPNLMIPAVIGLIGSPIYTVVRIGILNNNQKKLEIEILKNLKNL